MKINKPKVSICIPAYKQVEHLRKTLNSLLEQSFTDYELIVSDDSLDDAVENLLLEFDFKGKLKYFKNNPPLGSPVNWNFSITKAAGEYVKILHHDDYFTDKESLGKYVKLLDNNLTASFGFSGTLIDLISINAKKTHKCSENKLKELIETPDVLFFSNYIGAPSATIFRNDKTILFDVHLKWLVDIDWYIQIIQNNSIVVNTVETLICTVHGATGQITQAVISDKEIQIKEHVYLLNKLFDKISDFKKYSIFFQLIFHKYNVKSMNELKAIISVPKKLESFFDEVFKKKDNAIFFKKVNYWLRKSTLSDYVFTLKTLLK
jgi:glycosyltransferase involved in cell wall biosynthesis